MFHMVLTKPAPGIFRFLYKALFQLAQGEQAPICSQKSQLLKP